MSTTPNITTLEARITAIKGHRDSATTLLRDKSFDLTMSPGSAILRSEVETLEREIAGHERELGRLEATIHELRRRSSAAECRKHLDELHQQCAIVVSTGERQAQVAEKLLACVEGLGPLLAEFATLADTRRDLCKGIMRGRLPRHQQARYEQAMCWTEAPVSAVFATALWRAGVGHLGLDLDPYVSVKPPRAGADGERYTRGDLLQVLRDDIAKSDYLLAVGLTAALNAAAAEPGTAEPRATA
jgi:hypothetical protein